LFDRQGWRQRAADDGKGSAAAQQGGNDDALPVDWIADWNESILCRSNFRSNTRLIISGIKIENNCAGSHIACAYVMFRA
jgi:hypothetical protein